MKICKHCFRVMKEEELKYHIMLHEDKQYPTSKKKLTCEICKNKNKEDSINCKCKVEKFRKSIFELEKRLDLMRMKNMKENLEFERKMYIGRYIRNRINDSVRFFTLSADKEEALNIYDKNGEDIFKNLLL